MVTGPYRVDSILRLPITVGRGYGWSYENNIVLIHLNIFILVCERYEVRVKNTFIRADLILGSKKPRKLPRLGISMLLMGRGGGGGGGGGGRGEDFHRLGNIPVENHLPSVTVSGTVQERLLFRLVALATRNVCV